MSLENVEAAAMRRDIDRAEQWAAEPYSADDTRPSREIAERLRARTGVALTADEVERLYGGAA